VLSAQQVYVPPAATFAHPKAGGEITPSMIPSVSQYAALAGLFGFAFGRRTEKVVVPQATPEAVKVA